MLLGASGLAGLDLRRMLGLHAFTRRTTEQAVRFFLCVRGGGASGRTGVGGGGEVDPDIEQCIPQKGGPCQRTMHTTEKWALPENNAHHTKVDPAREQCTPHKSGPCQRTVHITQKWTLP